MKLGPRRFGGKVVFKLINLKAIGVTEFVPEMADKGSPEFDMVAEVVENQVRTFQMILNTVVEYLTRSTTKYYHGLFFIPRSSQPPSQKEVLYPSYKCSLGGYKTASQEIHLRYYASAVSLKQLKIEIFKEITILNNVSNKLDRSYANSENI